MATSTLQEIQQAIKALRPEEFEELYARLNQKRAQKSVGPRSTMIDGIGLFGSPEDAAPLDEVVKLAYEE